MQLLDFTHTARNNSVFISKFGNDDVVLYEITVIISACYFDVLK
jgi:hypothetical protein